MPLYTLAFTEWISHTLRVHKHRDDAYECQATILVTLDFLLGLTHVHNHIYKGS